MAGTPNPLPRMTSSPGIPDTPPSPQQRPTVLSRSPETNVGSFWDMLAIRLIFAIVCIAAGYHFQPFGLSKLMASIAGLLFAVAVILFEVRLRRGCFGGFVWGCYWVDFGDSWGLPFLAGFDEYEYAGWRAVVF